MVLEGGAHSFIRLLFRKVDHSESSFTEAAYLAKSWAKGGHDVERQCLLKACSRKRRIIIIRLNVATRVSSCDEGTAPSYRTVTIHPFFRVTRLKPLSEKLVHCVVLQVTSFPHETQNG